MIDQTKSAMLIARFSPRARAWAARNFLLFCLFTSVVVALGVFNFKPHPTMIVGWVGFTLVILFRVRWLCVGVAAILAYLPDADAALYSRGADLIFLSPCFLRVKRDSIVSVSKKLGIRNNNQNFAIILHLQGDDEKALLGYFLREQDPDEIIQKIHEFIEGGGGNSMTPKVREGWT